MHLWSKVAVVSVIVSAAVATPSIQRDESLETWFTSTVYAFFPNHTNWQASYAEAFDPSLVATFGAPSYNYTTLAGLYTGINALFPAEGYSSFAFHFTSVTAVPNSGDQGGRVAATGVVEAWKASDNSLVSATDGVFAIVSEVNGARKITEWREISNFAL
ncbi:hypothetical protein C8J56DRAFT_856364 [Mycena floridula]|nr:hypothetical protein C8J56DRAFT_856364 [Mycena floridula]